MQQQGAATPEDSTSSTIFNNIHDADTATVAVVEIYATPTYAVIAKRTDTLATHSCTNPPTAVKPKVLGHVNARVILINFDDIYYYSY